MPRVRIQLSRTQNILVSWNTFGRDHPHLLPLRASGRTQCDGMVPAFWKIHLRFVSARCRVVRVIDLLLPSATARVATGPEGLPARRIEPQPNEGGSTAHAFLERPRVDRSTRIIDPGGHVGLGEESTTTGPAKGPRSFPPHHGGRSRSCCTGIRATRGDLPEGPILDQGHVCGRRSRRHALQPDGKGHPEHCASGRSGQSPWWPLRSGSSSPGTMARLWTRRSRPSPGSVTPRTPVTWIHGGSTLAG